jgi:hypothetical protein
MESIEQFKTGFLIHQYIAKDCFIELYVIADESEFLFYFLSFLSICHACNLIVNDNAADQFPIAAAPVKYCQDRFGLQPDFPVLEIIKWPAQAADIHVDFHFGFPVILKSDLTDSGFYNMVAGCENE